MGWRGWGRIAITINLSYAWMFKRLKQFDYRVTIRGWGGGGDLGKLEMGCEQSDSTTTAVTCFGKYCVDHSARLALNMNCHWLVIHL